VPDDVRADRIAGHPLGRRSGFCGGARNAAPAPAALAPAIPLAAAPSANCGSICFAPRAVADTSIDHLPSQSPDLAHDPQLRIQRRHRNIHFHLGLHRGVVYGRAMARGRFRGRDRAHPAAVWQIYVAHVFLFTIFLAEISYVATQFREPAIKLGEMGIMDFSKQPDVTIVSAAAEISSVNMDVLPLYIVLMLFCR